MEKHGTRTISNKRILKAAAAAVFALLFIVFYSGTSYAATAKVSIDVQDIKVGETSVVTVTYSGDNLGRIRGSLTYDNTVVSYLGGGNSEGDNGYVYLNEAGTGGDIVFSLQFKGVKAGEVDFSVETTEAYDLDEQSMDISDADVNMTVTGNEVTQEDEGDDDQASEEEKTDVTAGNNLEGIEVITSSEKAGEAESDGVICMILGAAAVAAIVLAVLIIKHVRKRK